MKAQRRPPAASLLYKRLPALTALVLLALPLRAAALDLSGCGHYRLQGWLAGETLVVHRGSRSESEVTLEVAAPHRERIKLLDRLYVEAEVEITQVTSSSKARARFLKGAAYVPGSRISSRTAAQVERLRAAPCDPKDDKN